MGTEATERVSFHLASRFAGFDGLCREVGLLQRCVSGMFCVTGPNWTVSFGWQGANLQYFMKIWCWLCCSCWEKEERRGSHAVRVSALTRDAEKKNKT